MVANHGPSHRGFLGSTRYEVLDNPDMLIEIAEWESAEARVAHVQESAATGAYAPLLEILAEPFRATVHGIRSADPVALRVGPDTQEAKMPTVFGYHDVKDKDH